VNDQPQTSTPDTQNKPEGAVEAPVVEAPSMIGKQPSVPSTPPKNSKKMRTILLVIIGGILVLGIAVAIIYFVFFYVSKADYKSAEKQTNSAIAAYHKTDDGAQEWVIAAADSSATDQDVATKKTAYDDANSAYKTSVDNLANLRALKDGKVKAAYNAFLAKNKAAMANSNSFVEAMPKFRMAKLACNNADVGNADTNDLSTIADSWDKAFTPCIAAIKDLSGVKNVSMAAVGKSMQGYYEEMRADIVTLQKAYIAKDETAFMKAYNSFTDTEKKYSSDEGLKNVQMYQDNLMPQTELNNLLTAIRSRE